MLLPETLKLHRKSDFDFHYIYFLPWKDQMVEAIRQQGGTVVCLDAGNNFSLMLKARAVAAYVRKHNIQLIHAHLPWAGIVARVVGRITCVPVVYTEHNKQERYHIGTRVMNLLTMNWLKRVIAVSEDVEQSVRKFKPSLKAPLQTILNGVNVEAFAPGNFDGKEIKQALKIPFSSPVVGTIAVFRFQKRLDVWMDQAHRILQSRPDVHFIIVGDGPLKEKLLEKRESLGLTGNVHFAGLQTEVRPYLAAFDIYMMSSVFEGLPIALLEAMSSGCAVVSTDAGGIKEVIRDGQEGLLCPVDEPEKLSGFVVDLLSDSHKKSSLAHAGRERIVSSFSMTKMVDELEHVYRDILHRPITKTK